MRSDDIELGARVELVLGVLFVGQRLKIRVWRQFCIKMEPWDPVCRPWLAAEETVRSWIILLALGYVQ